MGGAATAAAPITRADLAEAQQVLRDNAQALDAITERWRARGAHFRALLVERQAFPLQHFGAMREMTVLRKTRTRVQLEYVTFRTRQRHQIWLTDIALGRRLEAANGPHECLDGFDNRHED